MRVQASRWVSSLLHEVLNAIAAADQNGVLKSPEVRASIRRFPPVHREKWKRLVRAAKAAPDARLRRYLGSVRNDGTFHYKYHEKLLEAYRDYFMNDPKKAHNTAAYVSVGATLKKSRFYFADAAAQRLYVGTESTNALFRESEALIEHLHHALAGFVYGFIRARIPSAEIRGFDAAAKAVRDES